MYMKDINLPKTRLAARQSRKVGRKGNTFW